MIFGAGQRKHNFDFMTPTGSRWSTLDLVSCWGGSNIIHNFNILMLHIPSHAFSLFTECSFDFQTCHHSTQDNSTTFTEIPSQKKKKNWTIAVLNHQYMTTSKA